MDNVLGRGKSLHAHAGEMKVWEHAGIALRGYDGSCAYEVHLLCT